MLVLPNAQVGRAYAASGLTAVASVMHQPGAADGAAAEVDEVPVGGEAVVEEYSAHGRDGDAVGQGEAAERQGGEEVVGWVSHRGLDAFGIENAGN